MTRLTLMLALSFMPAILNARSYGLSDGRNIHSFCEQFIRAIDQKPGNFVIIRNNMVCHYLN